MIFFTSNQNYKVTDNDTSTIFFRSGFNAECMLYFQLDKKEYYLLLRHFLKIIFLALDHKSCKTTLTK